MKALLNDPVKAAPLGFSHNGKYRTLPPGCRFFFCSFRRVFVGLFHDRFRPPTRVLHVRIPLQAERQRLFISREGVPASELESEVVALEIGGQFLFDMADHRDFLGAIVNLGITRDGVSFVRRFAGFPQRSGLFRSSKKSLTLPPNPSSSPSFFSPPAPASPPPS